MKERARAFVGAQEWIFAKTMADIPHFYCLKKKCSDPMEFDWFVHFLTANSVPGQFFGKTYHYFFLDGWKYWIMDENPADCDLINRELQKYPTLFKVKRRKNVKFVLCNIPIIQHYTNHDARGKSACTHRPDVC